MHPSPPLSLSLHPPPPPLSPRPNFNRLAKLLSQKLYPWTADMEVQPIICAPPPLWHTHEMPPCSPRDAPRRNPETHGRAHRRRVGSCSPICSNRHQCRPSPNPKGTRFPHHPPSPLHFVQQSPRSPAPQFSPPRSRPEAVLLFRGCLCVYVIICIVCVCVCVLTLCFLPLAPSSVLVCRAFTSRHRQTSPGRAARRPTLWASPSRSPTPTSLTSAASTALPPPTSCPLASTKLHCCVSLDPRLPAQIKFPMPFALASPAVQTGLAVEFAASNMARSFADRHPRSLNGRP